jgi:NADP-dependent 3-hydroxy acid dehydrogenase YdfG
MYNPFSLDGKTILITGASSGIGRGIAVECSKMGGKILISGRNKDRLQQAYDVFEGSGHIHITTDLTNRRI